VKKFDGERGQVLPFLALSLVVLLGAAALAVDFGVFRYDQRIQQSAADSAALAGASELAFAGSSITTAAQTDAAANGFTNGTAGVTVTVNGGNTGNPISQGAYVSNPGGDAVEVIVSAPHRSIFGGFVGSATRTVTTRAVGYLETTNPTNCITNLGAPGDSSSALSIGGDAIFAPTCGIESNGDLDCIPSFVDLFCLLPGLITTSSVGLVGNNNCGYCTFHNAAGQNVNPVSTLPAPDPCPQIPGCAYIQSHPPSTTGPTCTVSGSKTAGYTVSGSPCVLPNTAKTCNNGKEITFGQGLYVVEGGFSATGCVLYNSTSGGGGVTFYIDTGGLSITGSVVDLTAPTTGDYTGMLFYQNPNDTTGEQLYATVGVISFTGAVSGGLYFPDAPLTIVGNIGDYLFMVADGIDLSAAIIGFPTSNFPQGIHNTILVE
jgi:Flp pilus assembly protein TadG